MKVLREVQFTFIKFKFDFFKYLLAKGYSKNLQFCSVAMRWHSARISQSCPEAIHQSVVKQGHKFQYPKEF